MAYTFGTRIEDVPKDSFGNFLIDERLTLYPTREDAVAQTNPLGTATTGKDGYWSFAHTDGLVWVRQSTGEIRSLFAPESLSSTYASYKNLARNPDSLITGAITRDANGAATSAPVTWPDGTPGTYTSLAVSTAFPGAVDSYKITYGSPVTKTFTQPTITRDASTGAATNVPAITVA